MKKLTVILVAGMVLWCSSVSFADDARGKIIMKDTLYGAITGALVGAAFLVFSDEPQDHLEYIAYGAAAGTLAGVLFGTYEVTALATYDNGDIKLAVPTIKTRVVGNLEKEIQASVDIVKISF